VYARALLQFWQHVSSEMMRLSDKRSPRPLFSSGRGFLP
jgi:hypothetical protein